MTEAERLADMRRSNLLGANYRLRKARGEVDRLRRELEAAETELAAANAALDWMEGLEP